MKYELLEKLSIKCVIVGDSECGKSCLAARITSQEFIPEYKPTTFDNYCATINVDNTPYHLSLFDTSGRDDASSSKVRVMSYSKSDVFLVCFSVQNEQSLEHVEDRWVPELRMHQPSTPFILVGLQIDKRFENQTYRSNYILIFKITMASTSSMPDEDINIDRLQKLLDEDMPITQIAQDFNVCTKTIYRRMQSFGLTRIPFSDINDDDLVDIVMEIKQNHPNDCEALMDGHLKARTPPIKIQRWRLRAAIHFVDSAGVLCNTNVSAAMTSDVAIRTNAEKYMECSAISKDGVEDLLREIVIAANKAPKAPNESKICKCCGFL